jgi:hypothetical protein
MKTNLLQITFTMAALASQLPCFSSAADSRSTDTPISILNPVIVVAPRDGWLGEEALIGESKRPEWTSRRRFSTTRVYIQQEPGQISLEQWWRIRTYEDATTRQRFTEEMEIGLPNRMQLDLYYDWTHQGGRTHNEDFAVELRWALADWDVIPLNPTLYAEYTATDGAQGPDLVEFKVLLGEDFAPRWHWGMNLVFERELDRDLNNEFAITQGISYTIIDQVLSAGVEMQFKYENTYSTRDDGEHKFQIGPSIQWSPSRNTWVNLVGLVGCTEDSPSFEGFVIVGHNFGSFAEPGGLSPVSSAH